MLPFVGDPSELHLQLHYTGQQLGGEACVLLRVIGLVWEFVWACDGAVLCGLVARL